MIGSRKDAKTQRGEGKARKRGKRGSVEYRKTGRHCDRTTRQCFTAASAKVTRRCGHSAEVLALTSVGKACSAWLAKRGIRWESEWQRHERLRAAGALQVRYDGSVIGEDAV